MQQVEKLKIFLASPSDVRTEHKHVTSVVGELNRTVAGPKGLVLEVVSSDNAFPGYGKDGQAILNEQFGRMHDYELFIGIMWNRIGTPTPRAKSGTVEEFARAVKSLIRRKKPDVWFYFRQSPANLDTQEKLKQRSEVLAFRDKFRTKGLFREYKTPADFRDKLREHLTCWLNQREEKTPKSRSKGATRKTVQLKSTKKSSNTRGKAAATPKKTSAARRKTSQSTVAVKSPSNWIMLDGKFFQAKSSITDADRNILLKIAPRNTEQAAVLKAHYSANSFSQRYTSFSDSNEAGVMTVSSVTTESTAGKSIFNITLTPNQHSHSNSLMDMGFNGYTADQIAELRARLILLGEPLPKNISNYFPVKYTDSDNHSITLDKGVFPQLWKQLNTQSKLFLPKAWLWAVYNLKMCEIVESVLILELGPIKNKTMPIRFRGTRKKIYANKNPTVLEVTGNCTLSS
ncbi:hypothetical protein U2F10_06410 [Leptothoe sp. EHU-05/26/07-4]